jgi:hypothetical protein
MAHDSTRETRRQRCPAAVLGWIPWYPEGGLTAREKGAVEAHAAECGDCRSELDIVAGMPWAFEGIDLPDADRLFDEITARIDADAHADRATVIPISRGRALSAEDMGRIERWVHDPASELDLEADLEVGPRAEPQSTPPPRKYTGFQPAPLWAAAAALVLLVAGGLGGSFFENLRRGAATATDASDSAAYQLASVAPAADGAPAAPMLDVVFSDSVSAREIWSTLRGLGVEIVAGPTNLGVYRLRLLPAAAEGRAPTPADAAAIAARLVAPESPLAIFAEPVP